MVTAGLQLHIFASGLDSNRSFENATLMDILQNISEEFNFTTEAVSTCYFHKQNYLQEKMILVVFLGTFLCTFGLVNNSVVFYILTFRQNFRNTHLFYLIFLSFFDMCVEFSYILIFSVNCIYEHFENLFLFRVWHVYLKPIFLLSQVSMTTSTFLIVAASFERYRSTVSMLSNPYTQKDRWYAVILVITFAFLTRGEVYWEIDIIGVANCTDFASQKLVQSDLALNPHYRTIVMFWFRSIVHVFLPFFLLLYLNGHTMWRLKQTLAIRSAILRFAFANKAVKERKEHFKAATRLLVAIVSTYLVSNSLNIIVTAWEHIDRDTLQTTYDAFYTFSADIISVLTILAGSIRLPIYYFCNKQIRKEVRIILINLGCIGRRMHQWYTMGNLGSGSSRSQPVRPMPSVATNMAVSNSTESRLRNCDENRNLRWNVSGEPLLALPQNGVRASASGGNGNCNGLMHSLDDMHVMTHTRSISSEFRVFYYKI